MRNWRLQIDFKDAEEHYYRYYATWFGAFVAYVEYKRLLGSSIEFIKISRRWL